MGTRTRSQSIGPIMSTDDGKWVDGVKTKTYSPRSTRSFSKTMSDTVTPNFRKLIREGSIVNNPCSLSVVDWSMNPVGGHVTIDKVFNGSQYVTWKYGEVIKNQSEKLGVWLSKESEATNNDAAIAESRHRCLANVDTTPYAFGEDVGEIRETLRFLRNPFRSIVRLGRSFRYAVKQHRRRFPSLSLAQAIADVWLSYRFGFSPLLRSTMDIIDIYNGNRPKRRGVRLTARGFSSISGATNKARERVIDSYQKNTWDEVHTWNNQYRSYIIYEVDNPMANWNFHLGMRVADVPETLWALLPYSFMIDRVVDISSSIHGLRVLADPSVKFLGAGTVMKELYNIEYSNFQHVDNTPTTTSSSNSSHSGDAEIFSYDRVTWTPSWTDIVPGIKPGGLFDSLTETVDLVALILSLLRGR